MEKLPSKDIERMMTFINHEADEKIKEMHIKAIQEYNTEKARIIKEETVKAENSFVLKQKEIEKRRVMAENSLANVYKLKYLGEKVRILDSIYQEALDICAGQPLNPSLVAQCVSKVDGEFFVYCRQKDRSVVEGLYSDAEIRDLADEGIGGVVLCSKDCTTVVDNSFVSRMKTAKDSFEAEINKIIFE